MRPAIRRRILETAAEPSPNNSEDLRLAEERAMPAVQQRKAQVLKNPVR